MHTLWRNLTGFEFIFNAGFHPPFAALIWNRPHTALGNEPTPPPALVPAFEPFLAFVQVSKFINRLVLYRSTKDKPCRLIRLFSPLQDMYQGLPTMQ